jgi:hypothetical protein
MFEGIARKCIAKSPIHVDQHDYHDLIMNALMDSVTISSIKSYPYQNHPKNWDTEAKHFVIYVANMFNLRMMTTMTSNFNQKKRLTQKPGGDNRSDEEWMDSRDTRNKEQEDKTTYKQLLIQLSKYLASKAEGRYYLGMLPMFLQGYSSIEVATKLGVSEGLVSKYLQRMKEEILTFAKNSKNDELYDLMSGYMRQMMMRRVSGRFLRCIGARWGALKWRRMTNTIMRIGHLGIRNRRQRLRNQS